MTDDLAQLRRDIEDVKQAIARSGLTSIGHSRGHGNPDHFPAMALSSDFADHSARHAIAGADDLIGHTIGGSSVVVGAATTAGILLNVLGGLLRVREGDNSAAASIYLLAATLTAYLDVAEIAAPDTPSSGFTRVYSATDGLHYITDGGSDVGPLVDVAGSGGIPLSLIDLLGDLIYGSADNTAARLAGNITTTRKFLRQTGDGAVSAAPAWDTIVAADLPNAAADDATKGVATFEADDFDSSAGKIDLANEVVKSAPTDSGTATPTAHALTIAGGEGIDTSASGTTVTIAGEDASTSNKGIVELAIASEINTGTDTGRAISPDELAGSVMGTKSVCVLVSDPGGDAITTGDNKAAFVIPSALTGMNLVAVAAGLTTVSSSGIPTVQLHRSRRSSATARTDADMLSTKLTIDASEFSSVDAAAAAVIDTGNDDVVTGDQIRIDIDVAGTGAKGLQVVMEFRLP